MAKILVVEDESQIAKYIYKYLTLGGFDVVLLNSGEFVIQTVQQESPSLILLDVMLPIKDGVTCCKEIREFSDVPIIMLTAKIAEIDRIIGLEAGADDYVCKPFSAKELVLRVKALLRRFKITEVQSGLSLNKNVLKLEYQNESVKLTKLEFGLMELLHGKPSRIFSRQQIMDIAYLEEKDITDRAVDSHVKNLRKKIRLLNIDSVVIECVYGAGYQYLPVDD
jgi:two-component system response regulator BaeR